MTIIQNIKPGGRKEIAVEVDSSVEFDSKAGRSSLPLRGLREDELQHTHGQHTFEQALHQRKQYSLPDFKLLRGLLLNQVNRKAVVAAIFCAFSAVQPALAADEYASRERSEAARGHFSRARAHLVQALAEFEQARKLARPDMLLDSEEWRLSVASRAEELNRVLDPQPRITRSGVRFAADSLRVQREAQRVSPAVDGPRHTNTAGEEERKMAPRSVSVPQRSQAGADDVVGGDDGYGAVTNQGTGYRQDSQGQEGQGQDTAGDFGIEGEGDVAPAEAVAKEEVRVVPEEMPPTRSRTAAEELAPVRSEPIRTDPIVGQPLRSAQPGSDASVGQAITERLEKIQGAGSAPMPEEDLDEKQ